MSSEELLKISNVLQSINREDAVAFIEIECNVCYSTISFIRTISICYRNGDVQVKTYTIDRDELAEFNKMFRLYSLIDHNYYSRFSFPIVITRDGCSPIISLPKECTNRVVEGDKRKALIYQSLHDSRYATVTFFAEDNSVINHFYADCSTPEKQRVNLTGLLDGMIEVNRSYGECGITMFYSALASL